MNQVNNDNAAASRVVFYKTQATPLTTENVKTIVNVVTMTGPPEEAFLKSVQNVEKWSRREKIVRVSGI